MSCSRMYTRRLLVICGLFSNAFCKPLSETEKSFSTTPSSQDVKKTHMDEELKLRSEIRESTRDQSSPSNYLEGLQNLFGNGLPTGNTQASNQQNAIPPVMVLGMHQAILVPLNSLPGIFQNMLSGLFNTGNLQQGSNLIPNFPNAMG